ncbi:vimentin-type intermediate filament-associated coiled-coil protein isoform X1 [Sciurus carolinensis]|uniref:vimentin-type intermediate filament-associated coiled-coil protein isoform X1 n=1 Tax=Sciurus carolinensis TaxID=30640 RepID=UPI001FB3D415|nr:vimentin-type intermediate filament-associated coiled-coil protein isoform X1 [Sciurus carolinensis]
MGAGPVGSGPPGGVVGLDRGGGHVRAVRAADSRGERTPGCGSPARGGAGGAAGRRGAHRERPGRASGPPRPAVARRPGRAEPSQRPVRPGAGQVTFPRRWAEAEPSLDWEEGEIAALQEQLLTSEATVHSLQAAVRQRDELIRQLQPRAKLLQDVCSRRPPLVALLADLAEAERLGPLPAGNPGHLLPGGPGPPLANSTDEKADQDQLQATMFGTTV